MSGPIRLDVDPDGIPDALKEREAWVCWKVEMRDGEPTKVPYDPASGAKASSTNDSTWRDFDTALEYYESNDDVPGIGFMFSPTGPYAGVDLDGCRDPDSGEFDDWAEDVLDDLDTFSEVSPSATGGHAIGKGDLPDGGNRKGDVEMYDEKRFFTVTGAHIEHSPEDVEWFQEALEDTHAEYITGRDEADENAPLDVEDGPSEPVDLDDRELIEKAKNADDGGKFERLWNGNTAGYDSHSEGRMALLNKLAFWTGGDKHRMNNLYRDSGLHPHPKKPGKFDRVGDDEIEKAVAQQSDFYEPRSKATTDGGTTAERLPAPSPEVEWDLSPPYVLQLAIQSPVCPIDVDEDGNFDGSINDLRDSEKAEFTWQLAGLLDEDRHVLAVSSGPLYAYDDGVWNDEGEQWLREVAGKALQSAYSKNVLRETEERVRMHRRFAADELGAPDATLATESGLLDLETHEVQKLEPKHYAIRKIPTEHDPDAEAPLWEEFIEESVRGEKDLLKLQEYAGYCLWHHDQPFGKAMFLVGPTDSGKGTALKTIRNVLGTENVASESLYDLIQTRWGGARLFGTMANIRNEITPGGLKNIQRFKELTGGGDRISAEEKGQDKFEFEVTQKFLFATNQVPDIQHADEAFYNRCLFARFPDTVPEKEQDDQLKEKLKKERSGILNWMLEGLDRLMEQGYFSSERDIGEKKELCDAFGGVLDRFLHNCVEITGDVDDMVVKGDLFDMATAYGDHIDQDPEWTKQNGFTSKITSEAGVDDAQTKDITGEKERVYTGIRVEPKALEALDLEVRSKTADEDGTGSSQRTL